MQNSIRIQILFLITIRIKVQNEIFSIRIEIKINISIRTEIKNIISIRIEMKNLVSISIETGKILYDKIFPNDRGVIIINDPLIQYRIG